MMTTYYNFEHSTKTKVVGSAPGGGGQMELLHPLNFNSMQQLFNQLPKQSEFRLKGNSRLTDLLYCLNISTINNFIVSPKMDTVSKSVSEKRKKFVNFIVL